MVEVEDDRRGLPDVYRAGVGPNSMRARRRARCNSMITPGLGPNPDPCFPLSLE
jgi:hypothetical protein